MNSQIEELLERLVVAIEQQNAGISWDSIISLFALIASWITITLLLIERHEKKRPYLMISFQLVRSSLATLVFCNTGEVPLEIKSFTINRDFASQLDKTTQKRISKMSTTSIVVYPGKQWVLSLNKIVPDIVNDFDVQKIDMKYSYREVGKSKTYTETTFIDIGDYGVFLTYISETDELRHEIANLEKKMDKLTSALKVKESNDLDISDIKNTITSNKK
ncbi:MAG: hypothetical protein ACI4W2_10585 [Eubacterium sp.]